MLFVSILNRVVRLRCIAICVYESIQMEKLTFDYRYKKNGLIVENVDSSVVHTVVCNRLIRVTNLALGGMQQS